MEFSAPEDMENGRSNSFHQNKRYPQFRLPPFRQLESIRKWSDFMKTSRIFNFRATGARFLLGLLFAAMICFIDAASASARDDYRGRHDDGRYEHRGRGYDRGHDRRRYVKHRRVYRTDVYRERVYVPPPVFYAPPPPPGISIFFPPIFFRP